MSEINTILRRLQSHEGVEQVLLIGRDGLLVHQSGSSEIDAETVAALVPGLAAGCTAVAEAAACGRCRTTVMEWDEGVAILASVSDDLLLLVLVRPGVGFAPLLRAVREQQSELAMLVE
jgi:predicted regulator of Ras-like GTPase activity (Roadblock/LC7/MglB family)